MKNAVFQPECKEKDFLRNRTSTTHSKNREATVYTWCVFE